VLGVYDGSTEIIDRAHTRTDDLNLTNIWDNIVTTNNMSFWHNAANQLQNADGPWGSNIYYYDGIGNRTTKISTVAGVTTTRVYGYSGSSNRVEDVTINANITRSMAYDAAGNIITDTRSGSAYGYTYNNANRLGTVTYEGNLRGTYTYNGAQQLVIRVLSNLGSGTNGTAHFIHDRAGNVIAETDGTGAAGTTREYIWLPESGITDRPVAVISDVDTASPATYYVHVDHLNRPIMMTDGAKTNVWEAVWSPFGTPHAITGTASLDARFPGQWFQLESGLHYNWHRHYDPSLGRYTQPDPLGFVDGPSVYAYARNSPQMFVDDDGKVAIAVRVFVGGFVGTLADVGYQYGRYGCVDWQKAVFRGGLTGAGLSKLRWWWSARAGGGGVRLWKNGPGVDWHGFRLGGRRVNRPHYHSGRSGRLGKKHRPWQ